jgi:predicted PurR-regulated permease PerM
LIARFRAALGSLPRELAVTLLATVIVTIAASPVVALLTKDRLHAWLATLIAAVTFLGGLALGAAVGAADDGENLDSKIRELESRTGELGAYETYAEHLRDALRDLRRVVAHELPSFSTRDFVETGIFEPAYAATARSSEQGPRRCPVLNPAPRRR